MFPPLGPYPLKDEVGMEVACVTFRMSLRKGKYFGHLQWYSKRKFPTYWDNLYGSGVLVMGDTIYVRYGKYFTETACPKRGPRFGKFMRGLKLRMGVIKKQNFGVTSEMVKVLLEGWYSEWRREGLTRRREIFCLAAAVVIDFCGGLQGEEVFMTSLKGMLRF